jgi:hypothetical protein
MDVKEIFKRIKAAFDMPIPPAPAPAAPAAPTGMTSCSYLIDGGGPIYVDISDDGIPDIDANDKVYSDSAMTTPYPDGTYNVTGTTFGFTVAGGVVTIVNDAAGTGPGAPVDNTTMAAPPAPAPAPAPAVAAPVAAAVPITQAQMETMFAKFAVGSADERITNLETMCKALMECNYGYQIREASEDAAVQAYKDSVALQVSSLMASSQAAIDEQKTINTKQQETITGLFELCEKLVELPTADPVTLTGGKKDRFDRTEKREQKFENIAAALKQVKANN